MTFQIPLRYAVLRHWSPICVEAQDTGIPVLWTHIAGSFSPLFSSPIISRQTSILHHAHNPILYLSYVSILKTFIPRSILRVLHSLYTKASPIVKHTLAATYVDLFLKTSASSKQHFLIRNIYTIPIIQRRKIWNI